MKHYVIILLLTTFCVAHSFSQTKTFVREYTYNAGDNDSKLTSRAIALEQVKRLLLEEIGVYLESSFETENLRYEIGDLRCAYICYDFFNNPIYVERQIL